MGKGKFVHQKKDLRVKIPEGKRKGSCPIGSFPEESQHPDPYQAKQTMA